MRVVAALVVLVVSCDRGEELSATKVLAPKGRAAREHRERAQAGFAAITEGAPARLVWAADTSEESADTFANGTALHLTGWDPGEGGPRRLLAQAGNYSRPLLTPDGRHVVFTEKRVQRRDGTRHFRPRIRVVDWDRGELKALGNGFAVDTWADPATGRLWIYALERLHPARRLSVVGSTLVRFPLDAPDQRETVWTRTRLSIDSVHVSRDGTHFAGLFPWPDAGVGNFATGRWTKLDTGCWPALAPDDSYVAWALDGPHRHLRFVASDPDRRWSVNLSSAPDMGGKEAYHPRWSNHPRFIVFTGPYTKKKKSSRNAITSGGLSAEVYIGRLSADARELESTVRLTRNKTGDFYPDLWVGGAESAVLAGFRQRPSAADPAPSAWPPSPEGLVFAWRDMRATNELPGDDDRSACHLEARGIGRFTAHFGAWLDGGWFEADADSNAAIAAAVRNGRRGFTVQALVTEWPPATGAAASAVAVPDTATSEAASMALITWQPAGGQPFLALERHGDQFRLAMNSGDSTIASTIPHPPRPGKPVALALVGDRDSLRLAIDGQWAGPPLAIPAGWASAWPDGRLLVGRAASPADPGAGRAALERFTVHARALGRDDIAARAARDLAAVRDRRPLPRLRVRARVLDATEPDLGKLDPYHRMLVDHTYQVTAVLEGSLDAKKIAVLHWAVLDNRRVPGFPRAVGREVELDLEPHETRPELSGELTELGSEEFGLPHFLDVATPAAR